jgi:hypothetical protein
MKKCKPTVVSGSLAFAMLLSVPAFGELHPLQQQLKRQLNDAKATQEAAGKSKRVSANDLVAWISQWTQ